MKQKIKNINYIHFDVIDSTNTWAKKNAHILDPDQMTCITALEQTHGRGRFSRSWLSPRGQNIYATLYFCLPKDQKYLCNLGQVLSVSCATMLKKKGFFPEIKWPNDLLLSGKKVSGVLTEAVFLEDFIGIILGIGINVNMKKELLDTIDQPATSLAQLSGRTWKIEQILEPLLQQFLDDLLLLKTEGFRPFQKPYEALLAFKGEQITCNDAGRSLKGICHSIDEEGRLHLLLDSGEIIKLSTGDLQFQ